MLKNAVPSDLAPLDACISTPEKCVLAVIIGVDGPSYRPIGAMMAFFENSDPVGSLSSGCIESDIGLHAVDCLKSGKSRIVRYGRGSPYVDIVLPCGGGLEILLLPNPNQDVIGEILQTVVAERKTCTLKIHLDTGALSISSGDVCGPASEAFTTTILPELRFLIFGKGPEALAFAALTQSAGFEPTVLSPDTPTLDAAREMSCHCIELTTPKFPDELSADARTAIVLFFHDHDWEPPILRDAFMTSAFYIGAQGSQRARDLRLAALRELGINDSGLARLSGPIGLISSARDPKTLAISVLAEVVSRGNLERI